MAWFSFTAIAPSDELEATQTLENYNKYVIVDASSVPVTLTLSSVSNERTEHIVKKIDSSSNSIKLKCANDGEKIEGEDYIELKYQYQYVHVITDGSTYHIIGGINVKLDEKMEELTEVLKEERDLVEKLLYYVARMEEYLDDSTDTEIEVPALIEEIKDLEVDLS